MAILFFFFLTRDLSSDLHACLIWILSAYLSPQPQVTKYFLLDALFVTRHVWFWAEIKNAINSKDTILASNHSSHAWTAGWGGEGEGERGVRTGFTLFSISISEDTLRYSCLYTEVIASISIHEMFCKNFKLGSTVELEEIHRHTDVSMPGWFCYPSKDR